MYLYTSVFNCKPLHLTTLRLCVVSGEKATSSLVLIVERYELNAWTMSGNIFAFIVSSDNIQLLICLVWDIGKSG